jgi:DNA invertase Pin-like site-specific DNA recombinase/predicted nucleotidyltransferase
MTTFGYVRVSPGGQTLDTQLEALRAAGCERLFHETIGGANANRPELTRLLAAINDGDIVVVSRLDRLARSSRDLLNILDGFARRGAGFRSLGEAWADTTTPHGGLMRTVLSGLAEFERELVRLRTDEGRTRAKARGVHLGRPPKLTPHQRREALDALASGTATQADLVRRFGVSQSTVSRLAAAAPAALPAVAKPSMDAATERAARAFMRRLEGKYPVVEGILFGSRARRTNTEESDADIAVVLDGPKGDRLTAVRDMADVAFDVMLETGILVEALPLWKDELEHPECFSNPALIANIRREGLRL